MPQVKKYTAKQGLHLDCGHTIKAGETLVVTSVYTCEQESRWPLTILLACLQLLQQKQQTVSQPVSVEQRQATKNVYRYNGHQQPYA